MTAEVQLISGASERIRQLQTFEMSCRKSSSAYLPSLVSETVSFVLNISLGV